MTAQSGASTQPVLREVVLRRFPLRVFARVREQNDALMRELAILSLDQSLESSSVPRRFTELVRHLGATYRATSEPVEEVRDAALARGEHEVDLVYAMPPAAVDAVDQLEEALEEADEFCQSDRYLLTLSSTEEAKAFKRWYFDEVRSQLAGGPVTPWPGALD